MALFQKKAQPIQQPVQIEAKEAEEIEQTPAEPVEAEPVQAEVQETSEEINEHEVLLNHEQRLQALESALFRIKGAI